MPENLTLRVTDACNMRCRYCYIDHNIKRIISADDAKRVIAKWAKAEGRERRLSLTFHGGEPMLAGLEFYEKVISFVEDLNRQGYLIRISMQSNGTLFSDESLDYLLAHKVEVGLSLDGTELIHNKTRSLLNRQNSYALTVQVARKIKAITGKVGVITVITKSNVNFLIEIYEHFKDIGITGMVFNELMPGTNDDLSVSEDELNDRLIELFRYWIKDVNKVNHVEPFLEIIKQLIGSRGRRCVHSESCQANFMSVNSRGFATPCKKASDDSYSYGNILSDSYDTIMAHPTRTALLNKRKYLNFTCLSCEFTKICNGGCLLNIGLGKTIEGAPIAFSNLCLSKLYREIYKHLDTLAANIKKEVTK